MSTINYIFTLLIALLVFSSYAFVDFKNGDKRTQNCSEKFKLIKTQRAQELADTLNETSGLIYWDKNLYTHNDDTDNALYQLNLDGKINQRIPLPGTINTDWEDIAQDSTYIYLGDFGNNGTGQRQDLKILRIVKSSLFTSPKIDTIWFDYASRVISNVETPNATDFDCEAFVVMGDSLILFTKEWISLGTTMYVIPKTPGKFRAQLRQKIPVNGLITGADYSRINGNNLLILCGYSKLLQPFIYVFLNQDTSVILSGCRQKIALKLNFHQIESIAISPDGSIYLTNEKFKKGIETKAKLHCFKLK
jgi:hypothetical protein